MTREAWLAALPDDEARVTEWLTDGLPLWDDTAALGDALKDESLRFLYSDAPRAERLARALMALGERVGEARLVALGEMALGDGFRLQGRYKEAYPLLDQAAARFLAAGDELGWARTRIGWVGHIHKVPDHPPVGPIVERAAAIFEAWQRWHWRALLFGNYGYYFFIKGQPHEQIFWCERARAEMARVKEPQQRFVGLAGILGTLLDARNDLGHYEAAHQLSEELAALFRGREEAVRLYGDFLLRTGRLFYNTGRYAQALHYLYEAQRRVPMAVSWNVWWLITYLIAMAYFRLNRLAEAEGLLWEVLAKLPSESDSAMAAMELRVALASVLVAQRRWAEAEQVLRPALVGLEAAQDPRTAWLSLAYQQQVRLLHGLGRQDELAAVLAKALAWAQRSEERSLLAETHLLDAETGREAAGRAAALAAALAACDGIPWLRWRVHQATARYAATPDRRRVALAAAADDLDTVQGALADSFHAAYLQDAQALYDDLIADWLDAGDVALAWQSLERAKSRALINSMLAQEEGPGADDSPLVRELERLRMRHHTLLRQRVSGQATGGEIERVEREMAEVEEAMQVALRGRREPLTVPPPIVPEAPPGCDLLGFYLVRDEVHGFVNNGQGYHHLRLPTTPGALRSLLEGLETNVRAVPGASPRWLGRLVAPLQALLARLDEQLLAPVRPFLRHERLVVVPHGPLHQLPFHLLRHDGRYLLEQREVRVVPTARLAQRGDAIASGELSSHVVVSHSWDGHLTNTRSEGDLVAAVLGGATRLDEGQVTRSALRAAMGGTGVLHIAAHGEFRADRPELSHIQLDDGQLCMSDLFHTALRHSLVTLSACDTGLATVRAGDDPVGLWRGFLAAGARSLLVSLWPLEDRSALQLMGQFYERLAQGASKVAALRAVQRAWLDSADEPLRHPFFWGALQLIGDDGPLPGLGR